MNSESPSSPVAQSPRLFYLGGIAAGAAIGWEAAHCHLSGWAPVGLLSLGVGGLLGLVVAKLADLAAIGCRKRLVIGTVLFALVTVLAEHTWLSADNGQMPEHANHKWRCFVRKSLGRRSSTCVTSGRLGGWRCGASMRR